MALGAIAFLTPQLFFLLTGRATAAGFTNLARDAGSMVLTTLPQVLATVPYMAIFWRRLLGGPIEIAPTRSVSPQRVETTVGAFCTG